MLYDSMRDALQGFEMQMREFATKMQEKEREGQRITGEESEDDFAGTVCDCCATWPSLHVYWEWSVYTV